MMSVKEKITGIILAGGKSSRMGTDKGLLPLYGESFMQHIIKALQPCVSSIIIITNNDEYKSLNLPVYHDLVKNIGPVGGIYSGLKKTVTEKNIIVSCDIPFVSTAMFKFLIKNAKTGDCCIPSHRGNLEPLCAVYKKSLLTHFEESIAKKIYKMHEVLAFIQPHIVNIENELFYNSRLLANINTPADLSFYGKEIL